jgi:hypothetical protein
MINTWNESLLHEELKDYYCGEDGEKEVPLEGSICDAVREDGTIIEIQTANLGKLKNKLTKLTKNHTVRLVYPIAVTTTIETYNPDSTLKSRRKSPKKGSLYGVFGELTGIWHLLGNNNFTLELVFSDILEIRIADGTGSWRRKGIRKQDKKLLKLHESKALSGLADWASLVPETLPEEFTVRELAEHGAKAHAGRMAWTLRKCGILELAGKKGNAFLYRRNYVKRGNTIEIRVPTPSVE